MKRTYLFLAMLLLISAGAFAGSLPVDVTIELLSIDPGTPTFNGWQTGAHVIEITNSPGEEYDGIYSTFCVDPSYYVFYPAEYSLDVLPESYYPAAWVVENYKDYGANARDAQIAIWKLLITTALPGFENGIQESLFDDAKAAVSDGYIAPGNLLLAYSPRGSSDESYGVPLQDFIVDVPEPGSILLLGLGLLGITTIYRGRRR